MFVLVIFLCLITLINICRVREKVTQQCSILEETLADKMQFEEGKRKLIGTLSSLEESVHRLSGNIGHKPEDVAEKVNTAQVIHFLCVLV